MFSQLQALWSVYDFLSSPAGAAIFAGLWTISEALAQIPSIKANSVFQAISGLLQKLVKK